MISMASPGIRFSANPADRLLQPQSAAPEQNRYLAPLGACLICAILLAPIILDDLLRPSYTPEPQEIPVEILIEPPEQKPPDTPPAKPEPQPMAQPLDEKPAFDAPRAANNEKLEIEAPDKAAKAPPAPTPEKPPSPNPDETKAPGPTHEAAAQAQQSTAASASEKSADEATPTGELNREKPSQLEQHAEAETQPNSPAAAGALQFPTFDSVPDIDFGALAKPAPIAGGKAKATYLSTIYGMIMARVHFPEGLHSGSSKLEGTIVFSVDSMGVLFQRTILHPSGSHALDAAAYEAIGKASPFPRPPNGAPIALRFTYGAK
jgi:periplasmic protein TonB